MKLIVGLGNPGAEYARTRHNAGFWVLDRLAARLGMEFGTRKFKGLCAQGGLPSEALGPEAGDGRVLLVKPQTYMNLSGETVAGFVGYFKLERANLLVVADDVALPVGSLRLRAGGSAGGHNGLKDVERALGSQEYARLRVGIGGREAGNVRPAEDLVEHVLGRLQAEEEARLAEALPRAVEVCLTWAGQGWAPALNRCPSPQVRKTRNPEEE